MARPSSKSTDDKKKRFSRNNLFKRRKFCRFTVEKIAEVDYKDVNILKESSSHHGHKDTLSASIEHSREARAFPGFAALY
jgi:hypothetical protein